MGISGGAHLPAERVITRTPIGPNRDPFLMGIFGLWWMTGSIQFDAIFAQVDDLAQARVHFLWTDWNAANLLAVLLFIGAMGKSAQFFLHTWLPDAMEGPTPVSALIHAATMVTAGVFLMVRINPVLAASSDWVPTMIAWIGVITALFAATVGLSYEYKAAATDPNGDPVNGSPAEQRNALLLNQDRIKVALETLQGRSRARRAMWSRRAQEYEAKINSGDLISIAEVVRDLFRAEDQPEQSYSERQIFEAACSRLARELAEMEEDPLWQQLPAVESGNVHTVDRLGYPGIAGRIRLVGDLVEILGVEGAQQPHLVLGHAAHD